MGWRKILAISIAGAGFVFIFFAGSTYAMCSLFTGQRDDSSKIDAARNQIRLSIVQIEASLLTDPELAPVNASVAKDDGYFRRPTTAIQMRTLHENGVAEPSDAKFLAELENANLFLVEDSKSRPRFLRIFDSTDELGFLPTDIQVLDGGRRSAQTEMDRIALMNRVARRMRLQRFRFRPIKAEDVLPSGNGFYEDPPIGVHLDRFMRDETVDIRLRERILTLFYSNLLEFVAELTSDPTIHVAHRIETFEVTYRGIDRELGPNLIFELYDKRNDERLEFIQIWPENTAFFIEDGKVWFERIPI